MKRAKKPLVYILSAGLLLVATGTACPGAGGGPLNILTEIHTNGNGDTCSVLSVVLTLGPTGAIGNLNSCEWQLLIDFLPEILSQLPAGALPLDPETLLPPLTDAQALALVNFLDETGTETLADIQALADQVIAGQVVIPDELIEFFLAMLPPDLATQVEALLGLL